MRCMQLLAIRGLSARKDQWEIRALPAPRDLQGRLALQVP